MKTLMKIQEIKDCASVEIEYNFPHSDNEEIVGLDYEEIQTSIREGITNGMLVHEEGCGTWKIK